MQLGIPCFIDTHGRPVLSSMETEEERIREVGPRTVAEMK